MHDCQGISRRLFIERGLTVAAGASMLLAGTGSADIAAAAMAGSPTPLIIDVHHHPTFQTFREVNDGPPMPVWSAEKSLADMDAAGVSTSMLSLPPPVSLWAGEKQAVIARIRGWNDSMADIARAHPGRFGVFAVLPAAYPDAALSEIRYAFGTLRAAGVSMTTNIGDKWLGDPLYAPILEELNRRKAVVFVDPVAANCCRSLLPGITDPTVEFPTDTTRAIVRLLFSGSAHRYPDIRFIFSHAGGTMPYTVERLLLVPHYSKSNADQVPEGVLPLLRRFYYDVALSANPYALGALGKLVPASQILFGTDFPWGSAKATVEGLASSNVFRPSDLNAILGSNARALLRAA